MAGAVNLCVVIPVHKPDLAEDEKISLLACKKHLSNFSVFLIYPEGMDISAYISVFPELILKAVKKDWLSSVQAYNEMKLSLDFYTLFVKYQYMLTYELDAYIFNGNFESAGAFKFDFIGAPFFEGYWAADKGSDFITGCNSGFSVRNIQKCVKALNGMKSYRLHWFLYRLFLKPVRPLRLWLNGITKNRFEVFLTGKFSFYFDDFHLNEDLVWSEIIPQLFPWFTIADPLSALKFSFEYNLERSLEVNKGELPLGCHAWAKHPEFWDKYIGR